MSDAILLLRLEHTNIARLLDCIDEQVEELEANTAPDYELLYQAMDYLQNYPDQCHHPKEDLVLEAMLRRDPQCALSVGDLAGEHEKLAHLTERVAEEVRKADPSSSGPELLSALRELVIAYRKHMSMEEEKFFPRALQTLTHSDWMSIDFDFFERDDPLFDHSKEQKFAKLRENISELAKRSHELDATHKEVNWLKNLDEIDGLNNTLKSLGSKLRLVRFTEGGYGLERDGKLLTYIPQCNEVQAIWCAYYYAKGAENITPERISVF
jgi:hemerythrin-like domain-containing protein